MSSLNGQPDSSASALWVGSAPEPVSSDVHRSRTLPVLAASASAAAGLLVIGALVLPITRAVLTSPDGSYHEVDKEWLTGRYSSVVDAQLGQAAQHQQGTVDWADWPLSVLCVLALLGVAVLLVVGRARWPRGLTALLVFGLCWTGFAALSAVTVFDGHVGATIDRNVSLAGGWWFLCGSAVLTGSALVLLGVAGRRD